MKKQRLLKTLLVAVGLFTGVSAWADEVNLNPTGTTQLHAGEPTTVKYDANATSWACTLSSATGKTFKNDNSSWGGSYVVITQFNASSFLKGKTLTSATLSFNTVCTVSGKNSAVRVWSIGTGWNASTATWENTNTAEIINGSIIHTTSNVGTTSTTIEVDVRDILNSDLDKVVGFGFSTATGREQSISNLKLNITYTSETLYTATFTEGNSLVPDVTIYSDAERTSAVVNGTLANSTTYYYRAVLEGYENYEGSFTVSGSNPSVNFTMVAKPSYTIKAVSGGIDLTTISSGYASVGAEYSTYISKYICVAGNYYELDDDDNTNLTGYHAIYTMGDGGNEVKEIDYSLVPTIVFFNEWENSTQSISNSGYYTSYNASAMSGWWAKAVQGNSNRDLHQAFSVPVGAKYLIEMPYYNSNASARQYALYLDGTEEGNKLETKEVAGNSGGTFSKEVELSVGSHTIYLKENGATLTPQFDYLKVTISSVSVEVSAAGMATYVPTYDLDFSAAGIKAYKAKVTAKGVCTLTAVDEVPAGTPVLLIKDGGKTEDIPVMTGAAAVTDNDLVAGTGAAVATTDGENTNMILNNIGGKVGFYFAAGKTVDDNRAYLHFDSSLAPAAAGARMSIVFEDGATGINAVQGEGLKENGSETVYNLNGQRVMAPQKGLYIVGGKKVIVK